RRQSWTFCGGCAGSVVIQQRPMQTERAARLASRSPWVILPDDRSPEQSVFHSTTSQLTACRFAPCSGKQVSTAFAGSRFCRSCCTTFSPIYRFIHWIDSSV